jgi:phosphoribosyl 1,2-cyclic phosphodiesterase
MSIEMAVLGSGSAGNSTLLRFTGNGAVHHGLIDAGLSPRETAKRLAGFGMQLRDIEFILLTHLDSDHFREGWPSACERHCIRMHAHRRHARQTRAWLGMARQLEPFDGSFRLLDSIEVHPVLLAHDNLGTVGYVIEHAGARLGFATDLGRVPSALYDAFIDLDLLAIESNHDRDMQLRSNRPPFLKARIMGGSGHLSNEQSLEAVERIAQRSRLRHIVLLHLSRECNCPTMVADLYRQRAARLAELLTVSRQNEPTPLMSCGWE